MLLVTYGPPNAHGVPSATRDARPGPAPSPSTSTSLPARPQAGSWPPRTSGPAKTCCRAAIVRRGLPEILYADNGAPFSNHMLARTCAVLGIRLIHSAPYSPESEKSMAGGDSTYPALDSVRDTPCRT